MGRGEHHRFRLQSGFAQLAEGFLRGKLPGFLADGHALPQIGGQGAGAGSEGEDIHILVAAAVGPVYQTGLGCGADLIQQALESQGRSGPPVFLQEMRLQNPPGSCLKLRHGVNPAGSTAPSRSAADNAAAVVPISSAQLRSNGGQHVHVKEPAQGAAVFQPYTQIFHCLGISRHGKIPFAAGVPVFQLPVEHLHPGLGQGVFQHPAALPESSADQRTVLFRTGDVQSEADQGVGKSGQQSLLALDPLLPGQQHLGKGYLHGTAPFSGESSRWLGAGPPLSGHPPLRRNTGRCFPAAWSALLPAYRREWPAGPCWH